MEETITNQTTPSTTAAELIPLPPLPPVPADSGKYTLKWDDGRPDKVMTPEEFENWFRHADHDEYAIEEEVIDKTGEVKKVVVKISPVYFANALAQRFSPVTYAKRTYNYSRKTKLYHEDTGELAAWTRGQLKDAVEDCYLPATMKTESVVRDVVGQASGLNVVSIDNYPFNQYNGFPVNNCVIVFNDDGTVSTEKYRPDMMYTRKSSVNYNPDASTAKAERILRTWLDGQDDEGRELWEYLVQIPAQAVFQSLPGITPFKLAYMLVGEHDSGRSTFNEMLQHFFGKDNISTLSLQDFIDKYAGADLQGKFMNFGDDLTTLRVGEGNKFKQLVGISTMSVEKKYQDRYMAHITAVHAYSANDLPHLDENIYTDEAWWSRWVILKWNNRFAKDPEWMKKNLDDEFYEGFLLLVIGEVCKIIRNHGLTLTQDPDSVKTEWLGSETKLHDFLMMSIEKKDGSNIDTNCMLDALQTWAEEHMPTPPALYNDTVEQEKWRERQKQLLPASVAALTQALKKERIWVKVVKVRFPNDPPDAQLHSKKVYADVKFRDFVAWAKYPDYVMPGSVK